MHEAIPQDLWLFSFGMRKAHACTVTHFGVWFSRMQRKTIWSRKRKVFWKLEIKSSFRVDFFFFLIVWTVSSHRVSVWKPTYLFHFFQFLPIVFLAILALNLWNHLPPKAETLGRQHQSTPPNTNLCPNATSKKWDKLFMAFWISWLSCDLAEVCEDNGFWA